MYCSSFSVYLCFSEQQQQQQLILIGGLQASRAARL